MSGDSSELNFLGMLASVSNSYLTFASTIISAAIWPLFALLIIWMFRSHVVGLLPFVERFEIWGAKVELKRQLSQAEEVIAAAPEPPLSVVAAPVSAENGAEMQPPNTAESGMSVDDAVELLRRHPDSVPTSFLEAIALHAGVSDAASASYTILNEWSRVDRAAYEAAEAVGIRYHGNVREVASALVVSGLAGTSLVKLLGDLQKIRNRVAHSPSSADLSDATRFTSLATRAKVSLLRAADLGRKRKAGGQEA